ncbi:MAG: hypothetical protein HY698_06845 [Deltaproteobacteria bacterium]|nr:hypothetical protein [Deltaproteobacteria bacterium]
MGRPLVLLVLLAGACGAAQVPRDLPVAKRLDLAVERYHAGAHLDSAQRMVEVLAALPEDEPKRDTAQYYLAASLHRLGLAQAAAYLLIEVLMGKRAPELEERVLASLGHMLREGDIDESQLGGGLFFGIDLGELPADISGLASYYQALAELRHGFSPHAKKRLEEAARGADFYAWKARHALAVMALGQKDDAAAERQLRAILGDPAAPRGIKNESRTALARLLYERKQHADAFRLYVASDSSLSHQDEVLLESAWNQLADRDEKRALGSLVGLGAPVYGRALAPERALIRAMALMNLCQFRHAHLAVLEFRKQHGETLRRLREREPLEGDPALVGAVAQRDDLVPERATHDRLVRERARARKLQSKALARYVLPIYELGLARSQARLKKQEASAREQLAAELLAVDEKMGILDYELGLGLFRSVGGPARSTPGSHGPSDPGVVGFRFDGEYWTDELKDYSVLVDDRCVP